jgi:O-antigen/teichoic acid export membrane protein
MPLGVMHDEIGGGFLRHFCVFLEINLIILAFLRQKFKLIQTSYGILIAFMSSARAILGNTAVQILGKAATAAISIVIIKLLATYLGRAGFGQYTTIYEYLAFFGIAADFGIFQIAVRELSRPGAARAKIFGNILALRLSLTSVAMLAGAALVWAIPQYAGTPIPLGVQIAVVTTFLTLITGTVSSVLQAALQMQKAVLAQIVGKVLSLGYMLWVVLLAYTATPETGFFQLLWAGVLGNAAMLGLTAYFASRELPIRLRFEWSFWRQIIWQALPYGTAIILATIYFRLDVILLSLLRDSEEVGIYGVGMRIVENLQMLPVFFLNSALGLMTALIHTDTARFRRLFQKSFDFLLLLATPIVIGGVVLAYRLTALIAAPEFLSNPATGFHGSDVALQLLLVAMFFAFLSNLFGYTMLAAGAQLRLLYVSAGAAIFNLVTNLLVIPTYGFLGAAVTSIISELLVVTAGFWIIRSLTGARLQLATKAKILLAGVLMGGVVGYAERFVYALPGTVGLLVLVLLGGAVYLGALFASKALTPTQLRELLKRQA